MSEILRLSGPTARLLLAAFLTAQVALVFANVDVIDSVWPSVIALVVVAAAGTLVCTVRGDPFPARYTAVIVLASPVVTALVCWQLPDTGSPNYASWNFGAVMWLLFVLSLRGRILLAWVAFALMVAVTLLWCLDVGRPLIDAGAFTVRQAATLAVSAVFGAALRGTSLRIARLHEAQRRRASASVAAQATEQVRRANTARLQALAEPLLVRIVESPEIDDDLRVESGLVEAQLRDSIRAVALYREPLISAARAARARGVGVVLLDDSGPSTVPDPLATEIVERVTTELARMRHGRITARVRPLGRDPVATILIDDDGLQLIEILAAARAPGDSAE